MMRASYVAAGVWLALVAAVHVPSARADATEPARPRVADEHIVFQTTLGDIVLALYPEIAPKHCAQLLKLVRLGAYDSTWFYRVDPDFLIQLTDARGRGFALSKPQADAIIKLPLERSQLRHRAGVLSMAHEDGDRDSAETSFSILLTDASHLDGEYTIFGEVELGWPVVEAIRAVPIDANHQPLVRVSITRALVTTAAEVARMAGNGTLRPAVQQARGPGADDPRWVTTAAISLMMLCGLIIHLGARRYSPKVLSALGLLSVLPGGLWFLATFAPESSAHPMLAIALLFGLLALFKLMNRFESSGPRGSAERI